MSSGESTTIHVACAADAHYVQPMATMLRSLFANVAQGRAIRVHALDGGIDEQDKAKIAASCGQRGSISWIQASDSRFPGAPLWGRMPVSTYYKLLIADRLPTELDKVLWLDCDMVVSGDVSRLWDHDLAGRHVLAAQDAVVPQVSSRSGVAAWQELGLPATAPYFNAGVMMIDLALWRRDRVGHRALDYVLANRDRVCFLDQEGLNAVLAGLWGELDPRWNHNVSIPSGSTRGGNGAEGDPWILHYAGNLKPWRQGVRKPSDQLYFHYLDLTPWKGSRPTWSPMATLVTLYERIGARKLLYPLEEWVMRGVRAMSRRSVAAD
jgi:lipopolysaccharide biosynthesis glycosyltransferase